MVPKCVVLQAQRRPAFTIKCTDCSADHRVKIQGTWNFMLAHPDLFGPGSRRIRRRRQPPLRQ
jgi:hypothetical protein